MPKQTKTCRVCGKTYESCRSVKSGSTVFNWREMCCSPECGQIYLRRVEESRNPAPKVKAKRVHMKIEEPVMDTVARADEGTINHSEDVPDES